MFMICIKVEPRLVKGDNELSSVLFDGTEPAQ
jgi:hypothetical protein